MITIDSELVTMQVRPEFVNCPDHCKEFSLSGRVV
jgi:hypothetical protein